MYPDRGGHGSNGLGVDDIGEAKIEGNIANLGATTFEINGQLVNFSGAVFKIGETTFYNSLVVDDRVKARADLDLNTSTLTWNQIEFEN